MSNSSFTETIELGNLISLLERRRQQPRRQRQSVMEQKVSNIIRRVQKKGNQALFEFNRWFDKVDLGMSDLMVSREVIESAYTLVSKNELAALQGMASRIRVLAEATLERLTFSINIDGTCVSSTFRPLAEIGVYVPGGEASYPSSLLMCAIPAMVAGVERIVVCTPPKVNGVNPLILVAANLCGIQEIYQVGGAQAIAALSFGTESISPVQKIVGPGNAYVALAKRMVSNRTLIDMPAGPSELLVIADDSANPKRIALDMISQAEHSMDAVSVLVSSSRAICEAVLNELTLFTSDLARKVVVIESLKTNGAIYFCEDLDRCIEIANEFAPEHLQVMTRNPRVISERIKSAGLILLGSYSPVAASDYYLGVNHVLPTQGYATMYSGLSVLDFVRIVRVAESSKEALLSVSDDICTLADAEGLHNHSKAVRGRFDE